MSFWHISGSDRAGDLAGAEATGADIDMLGRTVDDRFHALYIGLPRTVRTAVRVRDLDPEHNALIAKFAFGHFVIPPRCQAHAFGKSVDGFKASTDIIPEPHKKSKKKMKKE